MNEHQPFKEWDRVPPIQINDEDDEIQALTSIRAIGQRSLPAVLLSDFDGTLCNTHIFDQDTNNHIPKLDPEIVRLVGNVPLVVATARRADNPAIKLIREQLLPSPWLPIIAENGGVTITGPFGGKQINVEDKEQIWKLQNWARNVDSKLIVPTGKKLAVKHGDTLSILRIQDNDGNCLPEDQDWLHERLENLDRPDGLRIENGGNSLTVQDAFVSKARAYINFLGSIGVDRDSICVIGLGDAENDSSIFKEADLSIGVHPRVKDKVDIAMSRGVESTKIFLGLENNNWFDLDKKTQTGWEADFRERERRHNLTRPRHWRDIMYL